ncbi:DinB family protein [bacterium]|nr:DinB family protein [bacterium]
MASDIEQVIEEPYERLGNLPEATIEARPAPGEWSIKEIVGHLVDSASNNHQRFVRLQVTDGLDFPDYQQDNDAWVRIQGYQGEVWNDLLSLWRDFNRHLARIIRTFDQRCLGHIWVMDEDTSITLGELMTDYLRHLKAHLEQIRENLEFVEK